MGEIKGLRILIGVNFLCGSGFFIILLLAPNLKKKKSYKELAHLFMRERETKYFSPLEFQAESSICQISRNMGLTSREFDAGASPTHQASQRGSGGQLDKPAQILKRMLWNCARS
jgi:hypothetical protein